MYITITDDDKKYYRTWSSGRTQIEGCTNVIYNKIPEDPDMIKQKFYKFITTITKETIQQQKRDENGLPMYETSEEQQKDENGDPVFEISKGENGEEIKTPVMITVQGNQIMEDAEIEHTSYSWEFDKEAYDKYIDEQSKIVPEKTDKEKIEELQKQLQSANQTINDLSMMVIDMSINSENLK